MPLTKPALSLGTASRPHANLTASQQLKQSRDCTGLSDARAKSFQGRPCPGGRRAGRTYVASLSDGAGDSLSSAIFCPAGPPECCRRIYGFSLVILVDGTVGARRSNRASAESPSR